MGDLFDNIPRYITPQGVDHLYSIGRALVFRMKRSQGCESLNLVHLVSFCKGVMLSELQNALAEDVLRVNMPARGGKEHEGGDCRSHGL